VDAAADALASADEVRAVVSDCFDEGSNVNVVVGLLSCSAKIPNSLPFASLALNSATNTTALTRFTLMTAVFSVCFARV
jgi:hypothetical protein